MNCRQIRTVAEACAERFGAQSQAGILLEVLAVCYATDAERELALSGAYLTSNPSWIDALLCHGDPAAASAPGNRASAGAAFTAMSRAMQLPDDRTSRLIKVLLMYAGRFHQQA